MDSLPDCAMLRPMNTLAHIEVYAADGTALDQDTFSSAALAIGAAKTARGMEPGSYAVVLSSDLRTVLHVEIY
jgi:hypothetical protein